MAKRRPGRSRVRPTPSEGKRKRSTSIRTVLIGLGVVLVVTVTLVVLLGRRDSSTSPSTSSPPSPMAKTPPQDVTSPEPLRFHIEPDDTELSAEQKDRALRDEQIEVVQRLVDMMPTNANALFLLAMARQEQGNSVEAAKNLRQCLELEPERADAYDQLGRIAQQEGDHEEAVTYFEKAGQSNPQMAGIHYRLGQAYRSCDRSDEAIEAVMKNVAQFPEAAENHVTLGELYLQKQEYETARKHYEAARARDPNLSKPYYGLATASARLGQREQAAEYRRKFKEVEQVEREVAKQQRATFDPLKVTCGSVAHTHTDVARVLKADGHHTLAEQLWRRAAQLDPKNVSCRFGLADHYLRMKRFQEALPWYVQVIEAEPDHGPARFFLGHVYEELGRDADAQDAYEKVTEVSPDRPEGFLALARFLWEHDGDLQRARTLVQRAVDLAPIAANYAFLSRICHKIGDREAALSAAQKAMQLAPRNPEYRRLYQQVQEN